MAGLRWRQPSVTAAPPIGPGPAGFPESRGRACSPRNAAQQPEGGGGHWARLTVHMTHAGHNRRSNNALRRNLDDLRRACAGGCALAGSASAPALSSGSGGSVGRSAGFGSTSLTSLHLSGDVKALPRQGPRSMVPSSSSHLLRPQGFSSTGFGGEAVQDQLRETHRRPDAASLRKQDTHSSLGGEDLSDEYIEGLAQRSITKSLVQRSVVGSPGL